jgi:uncharacterized GH25 family protein
MLRTLSAAFLLLAIAPLGRAHDFWLEPSSFRAPVGQKLELELLVGERFTGERVLRDEARILSFVAVSGPDAPEKVPGFDGRTPAGILRPKVAGLLLVGYQSDGKPIEIEPGKFESYLREEGLDAAADERKRRGETGTKGREVYARCAKSLIAVQGEAPLTAAQWAGWDRVLGLPLEIVPEVNPCLLAKDAALAVRVLYRGQPLANALVGCMPRQDPAQEVRTRTDAEGRVRFQPRFGGVHLLRVVHMVRAPDGADHAWESQWASLTFEAPAR